MTPPPGFDIKDFRQPVVTSLGVILGFLLGYVGQWVSEPGFALRNTSDHLHFWGTLFAALLMLMALYRMLQPVREPEQAYRYYRNTLRLYMSAIALALAVFAIQVFL
ncbi:hypothetical protein RQP54_05520 [Curvibacter sp. APW13]|uniref:hypothetical protein n=1 Tax=Curvibacter sp. APW13 TaxID=3077236 RepID=UPI0028DF9520|nr:hypothetical protein [Curvibacter sp. APW13]MDT8990320.1 hypothetical protein [Curvibacter sp. APW13]